MNQKYRSTKFNVLDWNNKLFRFKFCTLNSVHFNSVHYYTYSRYANFICPLLLQHIKKATGVVPKIKFANVNFERVCFYFSIDSCPPPSLRLSGIEKITHNFPPFLLVFVFQMRLDLYITDLFPHSQPPSFSSPSDTSTVWSRIERLNDLFSFCSGP